MNRITRTAAAAAVATAAAGVLAAAAPAAAGQDRTGPDITRVEVSTKTPVVKANGTTRFTVHVTAVDNVAVTSVSGWAASDDYTRGISLGDFRRITGTNTWRAAVDLDRTVAPGRYTLNLQALDAKYNNGWDDVHTFAVKKDTRFTNFDATPEPVRRGYLMKVKGNLQQVHSKKGFVAFADRKVMLFFKPVGGSWVYQGTTSTNKKGYFSWAVAAEPGTWQARYSGGPSHDRAVSAVDHVKVSAR